MGLGLPYTKHISPYCITRRLEGTWSNLTIFCIHLPFGWTCDADGSGNKNRKTITEKGSLGASARMHPFFISFRRIKIKKVRNYRTVNLIVLGDQPITTDHSSGSSSAFIMRAPQCGQSRGLGTWFLAS